MSDWINVVQPIVFTSAVCAAVITSVANIVISLLNNRRLKGIEKQKELNEIDKYRYSRLYELILNWHHYDTKIDEEKVEKVAFKRMLNLFLDDSGRYELARPLLDIAYTEKLDILKNNGDKLLLELAETELPDGTHAENYLMIQEQYFEYGKMFSNELKNVIYSQLNLLLKQSKRK